MKIDIGRIDRELTGWESVDFFTSWNLFHSSNFSYKMATKDIDASDPALAQAWKDMSDQKSENNWCLFVLKNKVLSVAGHGSGGYAELVQNFDQDYVMFGALKVIGKDVRQTLEALRPKYVFFTFIGDKVSVLNKAKVSVQRGAAEKIFNGYSTRLDVTGDLSNFTKEVIGKELLKCGGAHMPTHYVFGADDEMLVSSLN